MSQSTKLKKTIKVQLLFLEIFTGDQGFSKSVRHSGANAIKLFVSVIDNKLECLSTGGGLSKRGRTL
jgi:hypothetical protein